MNFSEFILNLRANKKITTSKAHYESMGGEQKLGISLRYFQQIEAGERVPSEKLLVLLFNRMRPSDRKPLVISYFRSLLAENKDGKELFSYLEQYLAPDIEGEKVSIWNSNRKFITYTDEQLAFLINNPEAIRFHKYVLLYGECLRSECRLPESVLKKLEDLELIHVGKKSITPSRILYRCPHYETSNPKAVAKASDFILKHINVFISKEGSEKQELGYAMQMVSKDVAERVLEQLRIFKQWVQSVSIDEHNEDSVPFIFVGFAKTLEKKELK